MTRQMFRDVTDPSITVGSKRRCTVPMSVLVHAIVLAAMIVIPLLAVDALPPTPTLLSFISVKPAPPPPTPSAATTTSAAAHHAAIDRVASTPLLAPPAIGLQSSASNGQAPSGGLEIGIGAIPTGVFVESAVPPPPAARASTLPAPVRAGGVISPPAKLHDVAPAYPPLARASRVEGIVIIEATISVAGRVQDAKVLRSIPLLDAAALDAVRQWEYTPTLLNGVAVPVIVTVTVSFTLH